MMTVKELIAKLQALPPDIPACIWEQFGERRELAEIFEVEHKIEERTETNCAVLEGGI